MEWGSYQACFNDYEDQSLKHINTINPICMQKNYKHINAQETLTLVHKL